MGREKVQDQRQSRPLVKWLTANQTHFLAIDLIDGFSPPQGLSSSAISFEYDTLHKKMSVE